MRTRVCWTCGREYGLEEFPVHSGSQDGRLRHCRCCVSRRKREYYQAHRTEILKKRKEHYTRTYDSTTEAHRSRKKNYGITQTEYNRMLEQQHSRCAICERPFSPRLRPNVDHDHRTGRVRGLLCHPCNVKCAGFDSPLRTRIEQYLA